TALGISSYREEHRPNRRKSDVQHHICCTCYHASSMHAASLAGNSRVRQYGTVQQDSQTAAGLSAAKCTPMDKRVQTEKPEILDQLLEHSFVLTPHFCLSDHKLAAISTIIPTLLAISQLVPYRQHACFFKMTFE
ncbi:hypothetical protein STEG23_031892, partial [Scotinomys teguina]